MRRDRSGNFTVMFALTAVIMIAFVGMGIDFLIGLSIESRWNSAADSSALAALESAEAYVTANASSQSGTAVSSGAIAAGEAAGVKSFHANAGSSELSATVTPTVTVTLSNGTFTATASFSGYVATRFGGFFGVPSLSISGASVATAGMNAYINYYIVVDTSQSMGIGSTQADQTNLYNATKAFGYSDDGEPGCVFGCHVATQGRPISDEQVAHYQNPPITLRIDAAKTAIQDVIAAAQNASSSSENIKIGLYTMQMNPINNTLLTTISDPTSDFSQLSTLAAGIDLGSNVPNGFGDSDQVDSLFKLSQIVPSNGNGFTASSPLNYVLVITDGMVDIYGTNCPLYGHCMGTLPTNTCATLQAEATVGVVYTTYLPIYQNNNSADGYDSSYASMVAPFASSIQPNLQACASNSNLFYTANDGPAIVTAMTALFQSTLSAAKLIR